MTEPQAQPPAEHTGMRLGAPAEEAGGLAAIASTFKHALDEMDPLRAAKTLLTVNQHGGFDCPGCAWPEPDDERPVVEFCENGAKAIAEEATTKRVERDFFASWSLSELARQSDHWLGKQGRLTEPMWRAPGATHYGPIAWEQAFKLIADELNGLASPDEAIFYTSGRTSNEAAFAYQLFVRQFGTNNLPDCSNMCHESSGVALTETIGIGKGTVTLEDFEKADAIFILGQNPGTNHPRMLTALQAAARRGCAIVSVNPLDEAGLKAFKHPQEVWRMLGRATPIAKLHLPVRINGDIAFLKGVMKEMLAEERARGGVFDRDFIVTHTDGYEALVADLDAAEWSDIERESGLTRAQIGEAAAIAINAKRLICCWAMGLTQHENAVATIREVVNLLLLGGHVGRPGAGACPVRGHSNVQGDRTMGIVEIPKAAFLDRLGATFDFAPPRHPGYHTVSAIKAMHAGVAKVFFALGGNFLSATPDTEYTAEALRRCRLTVHVSTKLNRSHLVTGEQALILPCLGRTEADIQASGPQFVTTENSMGVVQHSRGRLAPASSQLLSEVAIVCGLARTVLGDNTRVPWEAWTADYARVREAIARVVPGFEDYNRRVHDRGGFYLPNGPRDSRTFATATGKARFTVNPLPHHALAPGEFLMMTIRSHDQFNTTIYGLDDRYRGVRSERRVVFLNPEDLAEAGLAEGQEVDLVGHYQGDRRVAERFLVVPYAIPRRCAATYFPEANVLVPVDQVAAGSHTPASKSVVISLQTR
ncbi:MAG TPA: FdhF/YdeP family oxidoreductase [Oscillatoriaceae cyanobacterium]